MGFMKHFRSRSKQKDKEKEKGKELRSDLYFPAYTGPDQTARLPETVVKIIFGYICPHSQDETYEPNESSMITEGCMLCDLRDLSNCSLVKQQWYPWASSMLYHSVRIDAVHYCELEEIYTERRRRNTRNHEPIDPPAVRLQLLSRTVRENAYCAAAVQFLKLPYMTRETCKADLARTVSVLPNLRYVDLPDGFFTGDTSSHTLRQELQARCPHIRKMKYNAGSEQSLELLLYRHWQELEVMEVSKLQIEPTLLRQVLGILPNLKHLTLADLPWMNDSIFQSTSRIPNFPAMRTLTLKNVPNLTHQGLVQYLSRPETRESLTTLNLKDCTGIPVSNLHSVFWAASHLENFSIVLSATSSLSLEPLPPLASITLRTMHYEITSASSNQHSLYPPAYSYYQYLTNSLMSNSLPGLRTLYVRDHDFPETLTLAPPVVPFADSPQYPSRGFQQELQVYTKGLDELEWVFTSVTPADEYGRRGSLSGGRPLSSYSASKGLGPQWGGEARRSIVVGNGFGGFLAVPVPDEERPRSAGSWAVPGKNGGAGGARSSWMSGGGGRERERRGSRVDLWR
ncbi:hypothetical protein K432DRAFT_381719 [Lepidopterella palustris CBS 459.81]|uniref:F-box domain-containing protein n=1 Tax=Lepidopterella palustris CBS 459.81 TaxID=1314670 RepID=A0A8E2ECG4_9PEZI|nr:hypothetical protein K432DRAFT_381719 [Lepidopterella palustris CBS 459.81]